MVLSRRVAVAIIAVFALGAGSQLAHAAPPSTSASPTPNGGPGQLQCVPRHFPTTQHAQGRWPSCRNPDLNLSGLLPLVAAKKLRRTLNLVIPAAGLGKRLHPITGGSAKEMPPLGGKPLIWHALNEVRNAGFKTAFVVVSKAKAEVAAVNALAKQRNSTQGELQLTDGFAAEVDRAPGELGVLFTGTSYDNGTAEEYRMSTANYPKRWPSQTPQR